MCVSYDAADVVVIGAGAAGTCAAIEAARAGARTIVLEAFAEHGGAAATSGGGVFLVGTPAQRRRGIEDSVKVAFSDWMRCGGAETDSAWALRYIAGTAELGAWLAARGVVWDEVFDEGEGNSVPRWHMAHGGGPGLMRALLESSANASTLWRYESRATALVSHGGAVVGVQVGGQTLHARAVVVATGGFMNDPELVARHGPTLGPRSRVLLGGAEQARGDGHRLLDAVGALFADLDRTWVYPTGIVDHRQRLNRGIVVTGLDQGIWVNARGERFHDESKRGGASGTPAVLRQEASTCWAIFDSRALDDVYLAHPSFRESGVADRERIRTFLLESPYFHRGATLAELAERTGLPVRALSDNVDELNQAIRAGAGRDPRLGRSLAGLHPIEAPPFCSLQYFPIARKALGGVRTDLACHVLRPDGRAIPGLYAAGEVAGMAGGSINGRAALEGTMLGPSLFSGRIAGATAAADANQLARTGVATPRAVARA